MRQNAAWHLERGMLTVKDTFKNVKATATAASLLNPLFLMACLPAISLLSGCGNQSYGAAALLKDVGRSDKTAGRTLNGVRVPLGAKEAWEVSIKYEINASKAAKDFGGKALLTQLVPPSISRGTSSNQQIEATLTCDGRTAKIGKDSLGDSVMMLEVNSNSGTAILEFKGIVFNRDTRLIENGDETLSVSDRKKFTRPYTVNHEAPLFKQFIKTNQLHKLKNESTIQYADRVLTWVAKNRVYGQEGDGRELNEALLVNIKAIDCNVSSALVAGIWRESGVPVQIKPRVLAKFDGSWDFHADIAYYDSEKNKWVGVSPASIVGGDRDEVISKGSSLGGASHGLDIHPGYESVMVDTANDVDRIYQFKGWSPVGLDYNTEKPTSLGSQHGQVGDPEFKITHKITPLKL